MLMRSWSRNLMMMGIDRVKMLLVSSLVLLEVNFYVS